MSNTDGFFLDVDHDGPGQMVRRQINPPMVLETVPLSGAARIAISDATQVTFRTGQPAQMSYGDAFNAMEGERLVLSCHDSVAGAARVYWAGVSKDSGRPDILTKMEDGSLREVMKENSFIRMSRRWFVRTDWVVIDTEDGPEAVPAETVSRSAPAETPPQDRIAATGAA